MHVTAVKAAASTPLTEEPLPDGPGVYQLRLRLDAPKRIRIGRLGSFDFPAGDYVYTGSAMGGLRQRIERHLRDKKTLRWHIDYLLERAAVVDVTPIPTRERIECRLNRETLDLPGAQIVVGGFGASDCSCPAHLAYLAATPWR